MAARYWVGGTGNWSDITHWATVSGGAGGAAVPTSADDVTLDVNSGTGTITVDITTTMLSLTATTYAGGLTLNAGFTSIGNVVLPTAAPLVAGSFGLTMSPGAGATATLTNNGTRFNGGFAQGGSATGTVTLLDALSINGNITHNIGTFNTNNQAVTAAGFNTAFSATRTLTLGSSLITITGSATSAFNASTVTGLTITANTATLRFTGANGQMNVASGINWNGLSLQFVGGGSSGQGIFGGNGNIFNNLTVTGTTAKTDQFFFSNSHTFTGTVTFQGNSAVNRVLVLTTSGAGAGGSAAAITITINGAHGAHQYVDFQDINIAGTAGVLTGTSIGNALGNTNITFDASTTQAWQGNLGGTWSDITKWTSRVPLPQDDVVISSAFGASPQITMDMPRLGRNVSFAGLTVTSGQLQFIQNVTITVFGNLTLAGPVYFPGSVNNIVLGGRGTHTLTTNGGSATGGGRGVIMRAATGSYTLMDNMVSTWGASLTFTSGTFNANNFNVYGWSVSVVGTTLYPVTVNMGAGTWTLTANIQTTTIWNVAATSTTLNAGTSTISLTGSGTGTILTFIGGGRTYYALQWKPAGVGQLIITGNNTFSNLDIETSTAAKTLTLPAGGTTTIGASGGANFALTLLGGSGNLLSVVSSTPGTVTTVQLQVGNLTTNPFVSPSADVVINIIKSAGAISPTISGGTDTATGAIPVIAKTGGGVGSQSYRTKIRSSRPRGYWRLADTTLATLADDMGLQNGSYQASGVTLQNFPTPVLKDPDLVPTFDGVNGYGSIPYNANLNKRGSFSVEFWARPTGGAGTYRCPLGNRSSIVYQTALSQTFGWNFYAANDNSWQLWMGQGLMYNAGWINVYSAANTVSLNQWVYIVGAYDGTTMRLYINNILVSSRVTTYKPNPSSALSIGANDGGSSYRFPGQIAEVAVYDYVLSPQQMTEHWNSGNTALGPGATKVIANAFPKIGGAITLPEFALTVTGNPITDADRWLNQQGDGLPLGNGYGIWEGTTNFIFNSGGETNTNYWYTRGRVQTSIGQSTTAKFGTKSLALNFLTENVDNYIVTGKNIAYDAISEANDAITVTPGLPYTFSVYMQTLSPLVSSTSNGVVRLRTIEWTNTGTVNVDSSVVILSFGASASIAGWTRYTYTVIPSTGTTKITCRINANNLTGTILVDGAQFEQKAFATPVVHTDGATATRNAARLSSDIVVPSTAKIFFAARVICGFSSGTNIIFNTISYLGNLAVGEGLQFFYRQQTNDWRMRAIAGGASVGDAAIAQTIAPGTVATVIGYYDGSRVAISVNGSIFTTAVTTGTPNPSSILFQIGQLTGGSFFDGNIEWFMYGTMPTTLANADATTINGYGNTVPSIRALPASWGVQGVWRANTNLVEYLPQGRTPKSVITSKSAGAISPSVTGTSKFITTQKSGGGVIVNSAGGAENKYLAVAKSGGARTELWTGVTSYRLLNVKTGGIIRRFIGGGTFRALKLKSGGATATGLTGGSYRGFAVHVGGAKSSALAGAQRTTAWRKAGGSVSVGKTGSTHRLLMIKVGGGQSALTSGALRFTTVIRTGGGISLGVSGGAKTSFFEFSKIGGSLSALIGGTSKSVGVIKIGGGIVAGKGGGWPIFVPDLSYDWLMEVGLNTTTLLDATEKAPTLINAKEDSGEIMTGNMETPVLKKVRVR